MGSPRPRLGRHFHVVALDFRGHGDSDHPEELVPGAFERDLDALLEHLGARDAALLGHSMGAHIALAHASRRPPARRPCAFVAVELARGGARGQRRRTRLALLTRRSYRSREEAIARYRFVPPSPHASETLRRSVAEHSVARAPAEDGRFVFKFDPRWFGLPPMAQPDLTRVSTPTLLVRGAESSLLSASGAEALVAELPRARLVEIAEAGHNVHLEQPEAFLDAALPFLLEFV